MTLWGGRFSSTPQEDVVEFSESISFDRRLYAYDIAGSKAHVEMLAKQGIIPPATAESICGELDRIRKRIESGDFEYRADMEDIHMHVESALIEALGAEGARVHSARSRNDQIALDIRLYLRDRIDVIAAGLREFQKALVRRAAADDDAVMPGYTHLQHAQPVLFAHHLLAYVEMFDRDHGRLLDCRRRLNVMPLGSGSLAGSTLPIDRDFVCSELKFDGVSRNSMDAVSDRDFAIELLSALAIFGVHVSRLSEDLILWCSQEFGFAELDDAFCTGSSLMPQKKNPDTAELSRGKCARICGDLTALLMLCKGLPLTYNRDLQEDKEHIFDAVDTAEKILRVYPPMIASLSVRRERMRDAASDPGLMATDLAEKLVELGVPFRDAHQRVGAFVKYCRENRKALNAVPLEEMRLTIPEATEEFMSLFVPENSVAKRDITGATGYRQVRLQLDFWSRRLNPDGASERREG